jgi:hypothetical protein
MPTENGKMHESRPDARMGLNVNDTALGSSLR